VPDIPGATRARGGVAARLGAIVGMQAIQVSQSALMAVSLRSRRLGPNTTASVSQSALVAVSLRSLSVLRGSASSSLNPRSRRCRCAAQLAARRYAGSHVSIRARGVAAQRPWESWLCRSMRLNPRSWRCRCAARGRAQVVEGFLSQSALVAVSLRSNVIIGDHSHSGCLNPRSWRCRCAAHRKRSCNRGAGLNPRSWRCRCAAKPLTLAADPTASQSALVAVSLRS